MTGLPVLSIAGSDPSGGAGIQADLKAIAACGGYGMSVITALTAQNTRGVTGVHVPPVDFLRRQLEAVLSDVPPAAIKLGMLGSSEVVAEVSAALTGLGAARPPVVLDPVMVATSGDRLLDPDAERALAELMAHVDLVTPNSPELAALLGREAADCTADLVTQARLLAREHRVWVLAKAGHLVPDAASRTAPGGATLSDVLVSPTGEVTTFTHPFVDTRNTHGTGCTLSSAIATFAAHRAHRVDGAAGGKEVDWLTAVGAGIDYLARALAGADRLDIGSGHGPVDHLGELWRGGTAPVLGLAERTWLRLAERARAAYATSVVSGIASGHPDPALMRHYLGQDLAYLEDYAAQLDAAAALAAARGEDEHAAFWAASATACREEEPALHAALGATTPVPDDATAAYARHLASAADRGYEALAAALLPCFVLYAEIGTRLAPTVPADASVEAREWVASYAAPAFAATAARAMAIVDAIAASADAATRAHMRDAIAESLEREIAFFDRVL